MLSGRRYGNYDANTEVFEEQMTPIRQSLIEEMYIHHI